MIAAASKRGATMLQPEPACLLIADISGYTGYLAGVELDHAQDILADLLTTVVAALRPRFKLAKLEGDAAFVYAFTPAVDAAAIQDTVEATYFAFRRRLRDIRQSSRCACNACLLIPRLDLKFVVHHGEVGRQRVAGREELVGREVILVHRLLKNGVAAVVGSHAYALYTDACLAAGGIDPAADGLTPIEETIDIIGSVRCWVSDLEAAWQRADYAAGVAVSASDAEFVVAADVELPREIVWEYFTIPELQVAWLPGVTGMVQATASRRGMGTVNHCMHGKDQSVQEIIGWRPYEFVTTRQSIPPPAKLRFVLTQALAELPDGGTRVEIRLGKPVPRERIAFAAMRDGLLGAVNAGGARLMELLVERAAREAEKAGPSPALPQSRGRFLSEPVIAAAT